MLDYFCILNNEKFLKKAHIESKIRIPDINEDLGLLGYLFLRDRGRHRYKQ